MDEGEARLEATERQIEESRRYVFMENIVILIYVICKREILGNAKKAARLSYSPMRRWSVCPKRARTGMALGLWVRRGSF